MNKDIYKQLQDAALNLYELSSVANLFNPEWLDCSCELTDNFYDFEMEAANEVAETLSLFLNVGDCPARADELCVTLATTEYGFLNRAEKLILNTLNEVVLENEDWIINNGKQFDAAKLVCHAVEKIQNFRNRRQILRDSYPDLELDRTEQTQNTLQEFTVVDDTA